MISAFRSLDCIEHPGWGTARRARLVLAGPAHELLADNRLKKAYLGM